MLLAPELIRFQEQEFAFFEYACDLAQHTD